MRILDRYIGVTVAIHVFIVMLVFLSLFLFSYFINELDDVGKGGYTITHAIVYVLLTLPALAYQLFPTVALIGSIIGLGTLANSNELIAIRAAGVSLNRIIISVMKTGFLLLLFAAFLGEIVAPDSERYATNMRSAALTNKITLKTEEGIWVRDGNNFIHIKSLLADGTLRDIAIYDMDELGRLKTITNAKQAIYLGEKWVLNQIARSVISAEKITTERVPSMNWESLLNPELVGVVAVDPDLLSIWGLYKYIGYLVDNGLEAERYEQAFWKKIVSPLTTAIMVYLAIPFIFGPLRSVPISVRIVTGTLAGIAFYAFTQVFNYMGLLYHLSPIISVVVPPIIFLGVAIYLTRRIH